MQIRSASLTDHGSLLQLYKRVSSVPGGLARVPDEIDDVELTRFRGRVVF